MPFFLQKKEEISANARFQNLGFFNGDGIEDLVCFFLPILISFMLGHGPTSEVVEIRVGSSHLSAGVVRTDFIMASELTIPLTL